MALSLPYRAPRSAADRMDPPRSWMSSGGRQHRLFCGVFILIVGFAIMHVVFVGGQSGPLLPSSPRTSLRAEEPPLPQRPAKRAYTQLQEPTVTGSLARIRKRSIATHPLPPPRPKADLARLIARQTGQAGSARWRHAIALPWQSGSPADSTLRR